MENIINKFKGVFVFSDIFLLFSVWILVLVVGRNLHLSRFEKDDKPSKRENVIFLLILLNFIINSIYSVIVKR